MLVLDLLHGVAEEIQSKKLGKITLEEAKYRIEILNLNNNLTSNNIYIVSPPTHKKSLICPFLHSGKGYGYTVCIR